MFAVLIVKQTNWEYIDEIHCVFKNEDKSEAEKFIEDQQKKFNESRNQAYQYMQDYIKYLNEIDQETKNKILNILDINRIYVNDLLYIISNNYKEDFKKHTGEEYINIKKEDLIKIKPLFKEYKAPEITGIPLGDMFLTEIKNDPKYMD